MAGGMNDGKTLISIWADQKGGVHADFFLEGCDRITALKVNLRLDQMKLRVLDGFEGDFGLLPGDFPGPVPEVPLG